MTDCLIAAGSNMGNRQALVRQALEQIAVLPATRFTAASSLRETAAVGPASRPFVNACLRVQSLLAPPVLMEALLNLEIAAGRERHISAPTVDRPLDLDLLLCGDMITRDEPLILPHPRMTFRRFVLESACEIAPEMAHPVFGGTVAWFLECINSPARRIAIAGEERSDQRTFTDERGNEWSILSLRRDAAGAEALRAEAGINLLIELSDSSRDENDLWCPAWQGPRWQNILPASTSREEIESLIDLAIRSMNG